MAEKWDKDETFSYGNGESLSADDLNDTLGLMIDGRLYGDGSDGALSVPSGTTNLTLNQTYNYTTISVTAGAILTTSDANGTGLPLILKCQGDCSIEGTLTVLGKGAAGGLGDGETPVQYVTTLGDQNVSLPGTKGTDSPIYSTANGGGGGGASLLNDGANGAGTGPGTGGTAHCVIYRGLGSMVCIGGTGGGQGGAGTGTGGYQDGGGGGAGGGSIILFVGGDLTVGASGTISAKGVDGGRGGHSSGFNTRGGAGGGGGGGGNLYIYYKGTYTNSGTVSADGGTGGTGGNGNPDPQYHGGVGGAGGNGRTDIQKTSDKR